MRKRLDETQTSARANKLSKKVGKTRSGRDALTRVEKAVKGIDTHGRQWRRWNP